MSLGTSLAALLVIAVLVALFFPRARIRTVAQVLSVVVFVVSGLLTVALVVGSFLLEAQGGGVMLLFAVVPGVIAWVAFAMFSASRRYSALRQRPVEEQRRQTLTDFDATLNDGLARLARLRAERDRLSTSAARRAELDRAIAREQGVVGLLPVLRPALEDVRTYEQEGTDTVAGRR